MVAAIQLFFLESPVFSETMSLKFNELAQKDVERARRENIYPMIPTQPPSFRDKSTRAPSWVMELPLPTSVIKVMTTISSTLISVPAAIEALIFLGFPSKPFTTWGTLITADKAKATIP